VRAFADTNIAVYAESDDAEKSKRARLIIEAAPVISTQVVNETVASLTTKYKFSKSDAYEVAAAPMDLSEVVAVSQSTVRQAMSLAVRYQLSIGTRSSSQRRSRPNANGCILRTFSTNKYSMDGSR